MTLIVDNKDINTGFIMFLKRKMLSYISMIVDRRKLRPFDEYFKSDEALSLTNGVRILPIRAIVLSMSTLSHKRYDDAHIFINPNVNYPGTDIKLADICKFINFGNMSVEGYPIFTTTFEYFNKHINKYIERFNRGLG